MLDAPGMPTAGGTNPMVDFQLVDYERRHDPRKGNITFQVFSYGQPTLAERISGQVSGGADRRAAKDNLTGTADIAYDCLLEH